MIQKYLFSLLMIFAVSSSLVALPNKYKSLNSEFKNDTNFIDTSNTILILGDKENIEHMTLIKGLIETNSNLVIENAKLKEDDSTFIILIFGMIINILLTGWGIWSKYKLKEKEKEIYRVNLREDKRLEIYSEIYKKYNELDFNMQVTINDINNFINYAKEHKHTYLSEKCWGIVTDMFNYQLQVLDGERDLMKSDKYKADFGKEFNL